LLADKYKSASQRFIQLMGSFFFMRGKNLNEVAKGAGCFISKHANVTTEIILGKFYL